MKPLKILVVGRSDSLDFNFHLNNLQGAGYNCCSATSEYRGNEKIRRKRPDLLFITNMDIPSMRAETDYSLAKGLGVLQYAKEQGVRRIVLTDNGECEKELEELEAKVFTKGDLGARPLIYSKIINEMFGLKTQ